MPLHNTVLNHISNGAQTLQHIHQNNAYQETNINIQCASLPNIVWNNGTPIPTQLKTLLNGLPGNNAPCLYRFEILPNQSTSKILNAYMNMKQTVQRASAALKKSPPLNTNTLYVGKVKKNIEARIIQHLGYSYNSNTSSLQLKWWACSIALNLNLQIFSFNNNVSPYIATFELPFSRVLNPLIGKQ